MNEKTRRNQFPKGSNERERRETNRSSLNLLEESFDLVDSLLAEIDLELEGI